MEYRYPPRLSTEGLESIRWSGVAKPSIGQNRWSNHLGLPACRKRQGFILNEDFKGVSQRGSREGWDPALRALRAKST